jgi:hypothetical protein
MIATLKNHFGCVEYLMGLENADKSMVDNEGRTKISQLCQLYSKNTLEQIFCMEKSKQYDYNLKDANGWTCMHFLVANQIDESRIHTAIQKQLLKKRSVLEKKLGRKTNDDGDMGGNNKRFGGPIKKQAAMKSYGGKAPRKMKMAIKSMPMPSSGGFGGFGGFAPQAVADEEQNETLDNFATTYESHRVDHRYMYKEVRNQLEDELIECAEYLFKKGVKADSVTYDGHTMLELAIENSNTNLALWLIKKKISRPTKDDFVKEQEPINNYQTNFLFHLSNYSQEVDWEPIIKVLVKELDDETLHHLLDYRYNEITPINNLMKNKPTKQ